MPSAFTPNLDLEKPATGEQVDTWGDTVNANMDKLDAAVTASDALPLTAYSYPAGPQLFLYARNGVNQEKEVTASPVLLYNGDGDLPNNAGGFFTLTLYNSSAGSVTITPVGTFYGAALPTSIPAGQSAVMVFASTGQVYFLIDTQTLPGDQRKP